MMGKTVAIQTFQKSNSNGSLKVEPGDKPVLFQREQTQQKGAKQSKDRFYVGSGLPRRHV
jgi:hypothetical protein